MTEQERMQRTGSERTEAVAADASVESSAANDLATELDSLLDEIDSVLEENAEEFVRNNVQKGGQ
jgi:ubiquitin-like protein Pup